MLSTLAMAPAGPCPKLTTCARGYAPALSQHVDAHAARRSRTAPAGGRVLQPAYLELKRPVSSRRRSNARRRQLRRHAGEHRRHDLQARLDADGTPADRLHECAETETNA